MGITWDSSLQCHAEDVQWGKFLLSLVLVVSTHFITYGLHLCFQNTKLKWGPLKKADMTVNQTTFGNSVTLGLSALHEISA